MMCNSILAGVVSITAGCSVVESWASILIGIIGGLICFGASRALVFLKIDDPLDTFPVHGACGAWGCIAVGLFVPLITRATRRIRKLFYGGGSFLACNLVFLPGLVGRRNNGNSFFLSRDGITLVSEEEEQRHFWTWGPPTSSWVRAEDLVKIVSKAAVTPSV